MLHELAPQAHPMLPAGRGRKSRSVEQDIRVQRISLKGDAKGSIEVTCVIATELNAPEGAKPVQWRLLTNREVNSLEQASELIDWYRARWKIELFFLILKEGCRVESLQLGDKDRLESALAIYMVIAWRHQPADAAGAHGARSGGWAGVRARRMASGVYLEQKARAQEDAHPQRSDPADSAARGLSGQKGRW